MDRLAKKICETIRREHLLPKGARLVVGVSGGADSVALLLLLRELVPVLKLDLTVAHFNHGWRGADSNADESFVAALAKKFKLAFHSARAKKTPQQNREAAARDDRYRFLCAQAGKMGAAVVVAHHADDQAETFLINLMRGAGPDGLAGMDLAGPAPGCPDVRLVRPLLNVRRAELRDYLGRAGQPWREDASNLETDLLRNRVRAELLPLMASINPAVAEALGRTASILREQAEAGRALAWAWVAENAIERTDGVLLPLTPLRPLPPALRLGILREALRRLSPGLARLSRRHLLDLDRLADTPGHGCLDLPGLSAARQYDHLAIGKSGGVCVEGSVGRSVGGAFRPRLSEVPSETDQVGGAFRPRLRKYEDMIQDPRKDRGQKAPPTTKAPPTSKTPPTITLPIPGSVEWTGPDGETVIITARPGALPKTRDFSAAAAIDRAKISGALRVRARRRGDRYQPAGSPGRRPLKDVFNELRVPPADRDAWPLIVDDEEILWVPGMRPAQKAAAKGKAGLVVVRKKARD